MAGREGGGGGGGGDVNGGRGRQNVQGRGWSKWGEYLEAVKGEGRWNVYRVE